MIALPTYVFGKQYCQNRKGYPVNAGYDNYSGEKSI
jgi:hypothetical protein